MGKEFDLPALPLVENHRHVIIHLVDCQSDIQMADKIVVADYLHGSLSRSLFNRQHEILSLPVCRNVNDGVAPGEMRDLERLC